MSRMILSTQEKSWSKATLLSSEVTENSQETIRDAATFLKSFFVMGNPFQYLLNFQIDF